MNYLLIVDQDAEHYAQLVAECDLPALTINTATTVEAATARIEDSDILLGPPAMVATLLPHAPKLQWVQSTFAGVDALLQPELRRDYTLTGVKDLFGPLMSEYVFGWILSLERSLFTLREQQKKHLWREIPYRGLSGQTLGVAGLGSIGRHIAATATHFGMRVLGYRRSPGACDAVERVYAGDELHAFLGELDYLVLVLPSTAETTHLIDSTALAAMKASAVLINVGRGNVVKEDDLVEALAAGHPRGAVLDVFEQEPLSQRSRLWDLSNCHITPHIAATSFPDDIAAVFCENYRRFAKGESLNFVIDFEKGY